MPVKMTTHGLEFSWPNIHEAARLEVLLHRTLRIPDDGNIHNLPPSLGYFPKGATWQFDTLPDGLRDGYIIPLYQAEAMWLGFNGHYPAALQVAAGEINAVTGDAADDTLNDDPQNYVAIPGQPWLDGFVVEKGRIRQFVAMPLDSGFTVEEQLTGKAEFGGLRLTVYPARPELYERNMGQRSRGFLGMVQVSASSVPAATRGIAPPAQQMGLGEGGSMSQDIYEDEYSPDDYLGDSAQTAVINMVNALDWFDLTGEPPPYQPPTAEVYQRHGLPWFDYYSDRKALEGSEKLSGLQTVQDLLIAMGGEKLDEDLDPDAVPVVHLKKGSKNEVE